MATIVVIDDEPGLLRVIRRILEPAGHLVLVAENAGEGIELCREHRPDVVITDIFIRDKWGIDTIRELKRVVAAAKVVAISGTPAGKNSILDLARAVGADAVLAKPFRAAELHATLQGLQIGVTPPAP